MTGTLFDNLRLARMLAGQEIGLDWESISPEDWKLVVKQSIAEDVAPQLYWALSNDGKISLLPKAEQNQLRAIFFSTRMKNEQNLTELKALTRMFALSDIPVVALKGICLALTIYPDPGLRPMVDMDLLVPVSRLPDAMRIVRNAGYQAALPEAAPGHIETLNHAVCMVKSRFPFTTLELHHTLVGEEAFQFAVPVDWFWTQIEPLKRNSHKLRADDLSVLTPTAQILYACAHAMLQHGSRNTSLCWLYDLDQMIRVHAHRLDWNLFLAQARVFDWNSSAFAALSQVVALFDTPIPPGLLDSLAAHPDRNLQRVIEMQTQPATHTLEEYQKYKSLDAGGRIKLLLGLVMPGPAYMRWRYGMKSSWTMPFWYIYRWWTIFEDMLHTGWVLLLKKRPVKQNEIAG